MDVIWEYGLLCCSLNPVKTRFHLAQKPGANPGVTSAADAWRPAGDRPLAAWRRVQAVKLWWEGVWGGAGDSSTQRPCCWVSGWLIVGMTSGQVANSGILPWSQAVTAAGSTRWGARRWHQTPKVHNREGQGAFLTRLCVVVCTCNKFLTSLGRTELFKHQKGILQDQSCVWVKNHSFHLLMISDTLHEF